MKWKSGVTIEKDGGFFLCMGEKNRQLEEEDISIAELIESGITDDEELTAKVAEYFGENELMADFRLAQFVADYGEFIAQASQSRVFEI